MATTRSNFAHAKRKRWGKFCLAAAPVTGITDRIAALGNAGDVALGGSCHVRVTGNASQPHFGLARSGYRAWYRHHRSLGNLAGLLNVRTYPVDQRCKLSVGGSNQIRHLGCIDQRVNRAHLVMLRRVATVPH
jgi:hypothetical protein